MKIIGSMEVTEGYAHWKKSSASVYRTESVIEHRLSAGGPKVLMILSFRSVESVNQ